ncbi:MAG TPA: twin-arginine translocase subunit TatC [Ktedonobacteraceae bacterium]|nr:twin-arginine translocase subunit TatC [Ktedonobacteraceae bacterium]
MATRNIDQRDPDEIVDDLDLEDDDDDDDDEEEDEGGATMTLIEHLEELRWRIFKSAIAIVVFGIVAFIFRDPIEKFLTYPLPKTADALGTGKIVVTGVGEGFTVYLKISFAVGLLLALPIVLYQIWAFISPGLLAKEKKNAVPFIVIGIVLFVMGVALGYIVLRFPVEWLINFASDSFTPLITADSYFTFVTYFMLAFGIVFEIPLVLTFMAQLGLITAKTLTKRRAMAYVIMWVAATFLTPGADPYSPVILGVAMTFLFELTVIFIRIFNRQESEAVA